MGASSPDVPFTETKGRFTFLGEQFWGRAARASSDSKESDARFICPGFCRYRYARSIDQ